MAGDAKIPNVGSRFHFVPADDPTGHVSNGRSSTQLYATAARKHVMRQVGDKKRREKPSKRKHYTQFELEMAEPDPWQATSSDQTSALIASPPFSRTSAGDTEVQRSTAGASSQAFHLTRQGLDNAHVLPDLARSLGSGRLDPFLKYPAQLAPRARMLLDYMLDSKTTILRSFRLTWYPLMWTGDPAVFYQALSNTCTALGKMLAIPALIDVEATRYHAAALESVNKRIQDPKEFICDGIVASVIGFAFHMTQVALDDWDTHMKGLQSIIEARGGPDSIRQGPLRKMLFLVDVAGSARRDLKPRFALPVHLLPDPKYIQTLHQPSDTVARSLATWLSRFPQHAEIAQVLQDLSIVVWWMETEAAQDADFYLSTDTSGAWVSPIIHRCLQLIPEGDSNTLASSSAMQEALRHACILFIQHIRRAFGVVVDGNEFRVKKLKIALMQCSEEWTGLGELLRWIVVSGGLEATDLKDQIWFASLLAFHPRLNEGSEADHLEAVKRFVWFSGIPEDRTESLSDRARDIRAAVID